MFLNQVHEIPNAPDELDSTALRLHGKVYVLLTDAEASAVWDDIESREKS